MSTTIQRDWAIEEAEKILGNLHEHLGTAVWWDHDVEVVAHALRSERERCAVVADSAATDWHRRECGCSECMTAHEIADAIRSGK